MAIVSTAVSVASTATAVFTFTAENQYILVQNNDSVDIYFGGSDVSTTNGFKLVAGGSFQAHGSVGEVLYGRVASSTANVRVLKQGG